MNPEAVQWLEQLSDEDRYDWFTQVGSNKGLVQVKDDHETYRGGCRFCGPASVNGELVVVG